MKPIELDGRTGEGGGQLVRLAVGLSALTTRPVKITNVRGNRQGGRGGGLKSQHVTAIEFLASVTDAETEGLEVGSHTLTFIPRLPPSSLTQRKFSISAASGAASTLLVLQAILPFLLFASGDPIELEISGGTNASFSLSFEYLDQILLPTLQERFGVKLERKLLSRGWSLGKQSRGSIHIRVHPIPRGESIRCSSPVPRHIPESFTVKSVDISIITPTSAHAILQTTLVYHLNDLFPDTDVKFLETSDSGDPARIYVLLVAHSASGIRWGRDVLTSLPKKVKSPETFLEQMSSRLCRELHEEISLAGEVDEHLQDQLICFQAISEGYSSFQRLDSPASNEELDDIAATLAALENSDKDVRKAKTTEPFGNGSLHTKTARWVAAEMLPEVDFFKKGDIVKGAGIAAS